MPRITPGNRLYLYQLFSREVGVGRQTMLARMEEVLAADDIMPCDMGFESVRELLEALDDFVRLTVFKKGRVYATVLAQPAWDEILARTDAPAQNPTPTAKGGPKSWKRKRANKDPRPAKPKPYGRPVVAEPTIAPEADEATTPETTLESDAKAVTQTDNESAIAAQVDDGPAANTQATDGSVTKADGKTTPTADAETDESAATTPHEKTEPATEEKSAAQVDTQPADEQPTTQADGQPADTLPTDEQSKTDETTEAMPKALSTATTADPDAESTPVPESPTEVTPESISAPEPPREPSITFTITYDPYEGLEEFVVTELEPTQVPGTTHAAATTAPSHATETTNASAAPAAATAEPAAEPALTKPIPNVHHGLPQHFPTDVRCPDEPFSLLYQVLPFDVDPLALLDEDWRVARATDSFVQDGPTVSFPLRYLRAEGADPVQVTIRRGKNATSSAKPWTLVSVDADDLVEHGISMNGLPTADEGPWSDISLPANGTTTPTTPLRELAQFAHLGPWENLLPQLADLAEPEPWGDDLAVLKEYVLLTIHRIRREDKLATWENGLRAAIDTGLLTAEGAHIQLHFVAQQGDVPWTFDRIQAQAPDKTRDQHESDNPTPLPASYITELSHITLAPPYEATPAKALARAYGKQLHAALRHSLAQARRNYRVATPAYDPIANELRLLLPIRPEGPKSPLRAVVLAPHSSGGYLATAILPLDRAYACARVVSAELPRWMSLQ